MTPENLNEAKPHEYKKSLKANESILVNDQYGITVTSQHDRIHLSVFDGQTMNRLTNDLESGVFNHLTIGNIIINALQGEKDETEIKIESDTHIQSIEYNYLQDFPKLFNYRRQKREAESTLSSGDNRQPQ